MVKVFGGSSSRSYPQTGQRYMVFKPSFTVRLKILKSCSPVARQRPQDHECRKMAAPCQHSEFIGSRVEAHQISVARAFQGSLPQWPHHKSVCQPFVLSGTCGSKLFPMPHEMPLKIMAVFKRHGVVGVPKLYIGREMACGALDCVDIELDFIIARRWPELLFRRAASSRLQSNFLLK